MSALAPAGIARSGAIMAEMFVDDDGDGVRGAGEDAVAGGRFIVGAALRREATGADERVLIGGIAPGPATTIETQMSSLTDFPLRPARSGDSLALRPGEVRHVPIALRPTVSIEVQVLLVVGDERTPRSGVAVVLRDATGREAARATSDFDGFVLFEGLAFGTYQAEAAGQHLGPLAVSREAPDGSARVLIAGGTRLKASPGVRPASPPAPARSLRRRGRRQRRARPAPSPASRRAGPAPRPGRGVRRS